MNPYIKLAHFSSILRERALEKRAGLMSSGLNAARSVGGYVARKAGVGGLLSAGLAGGAGVSQAAKTFKQTNSSFKPSTPQQVMAGPTLPPPG